MNQDEIAAAILQPHFSAVQDVFVAHKVAPGKTMSKLAKTRLVVDENMHDTPRHFAACRDDGTLIMLAPQMADLDIMHVVAIITHEFGHAADFAYPAMWMGPMRQAGVAVWVGDGDGPEARAWQRAWNRRNADQVEWAADGIAEAVTGRRIGYTGQCVLQTFDRGQSRPAGLR